MARDLVGVLDWSFFISQNFFFSFECGLQCINGSEKIFSCVAYHICQTTEWSTQNAEYHSCVSHDFAVLFRWKHKCHLAATQSIGIDSKCMKWGYGSLSYNNHLTCIGVSEFCHTSVFFVHNCFTFFVVVVGIVSISFLSARIFLNLFFFLISRSVCSHSRRIWWESIWKTNAK